MSIKTFVLASLCASLSLALQAAEPVRAVPLDSLKLSGIQTGWGQVRAGKSAEGNPLSIGGRKFAAGLGMHAAGAMTLALDGQAESFQAFVGVDDEVPQGRGTVEFSAIADGKEVWRSGVMKSGDAAKEVAIPLKGVRSLRLLVGDGGDDNRHDHADWAEARILGADPASVKLALPPEPPVRWRLAPGTATEWTIAGSGLPHSDFIEQGGRRAGQKVWYTVDADGRLKLERDVVWPSLRVPPNDTHSSLIAHYGAAAEPVISVDGQTAGPIQVSRILLDGTLTVEGRIGSLAVRRVTFPSMTAYATVDAWTLTNAGNRPAKVAVAPLALHSERKSPYGLNLMDAQGPGVPETELAPGAALTFAVVFSARQPEYPPVVVDPRVEEQGRRAFIAGLDRSLILETPDPELDRAFAFAKWRVAEAVNDTRGGLMLAPGNLRFYAATWCNDNVEYAGPFFPFLGDEGGNGASLNAYRHYRPFMKSDYQHIPSSIIAEGRGTWGGAGDRGDAAMYAYGASRFSLAQGDRAMAEELWPGIVWTLEYCRRQLTKEGVVASDSDELEGRLSAGKANLNTSCLYYGGLRSAADLGRALGKAAEAADYDRRATELARAIEAYFGATVEGFGTYRYHAGCDRLRAWISMPLSMNLFDRKEATVAALFSEKMWTPDGLASQSGDTIFWDRSTLYALRAVFQAGETAKATEFLKRYTRRRLLGEHVPYAVEAYPEGGQGHLASESGLYCRIYVEGMFGLLPTGLDRFTLTPRLPEGWPAMALRHVKAFGSDFDIAVARAGGKLSVRVAAAGQEILAKEIAPGETVEVVLPAK